VRLPAYVSALALVACGPMTEDEPAGVPSVEPFKELVVVDDAVMSDSAAQNAAGGPFSFRHVMERLAVSGDGVTVAWLDQWAPASVVERRLELARAPFRLIAIANRIDLSEGEGRLVFAVTDGPGDDPRSPSLPLTVIFEFRLAGDRTEWASLWHALGAHRDFDAGYIQSLAGVTERFVRAEDLAQVRINDGASMLEFHLDVGARRFVREGLRRTPPHSMDGSEELRRFVSAHQDDILADRYELPTSMLTSRIELGGSWNLPGIEEPLRRAFAGNTCDGCHGEEHPTTGGAFHVSPSERGTAKLSRFLFDPEHREDDELTRRAAVLARLTSAP